MFGLRYLSDVVTLRLDEERCNGCKMCVIVCPHSVFVVENRKALIVDRNVCMECGACALNCPEDALSVEAGVGCAAAVINGYTRGTEPVCDCGTEKSSCCQ